MSPGVCAYCEDAPAMDGSVCCEDCDFLIDDTERQDEMERIEHNDVCDVCTFGRIGLDGECEECGAEA